MGLPRYPRTLTTRSSPSFNSRGTRKITHREYHPDRHQDTEDLVQGRLGRHKAWVLVFGDRLDFASNPSVRIFRG